MSLLGGMVAASYSVSVFFINASCLFVVCLLSLPGGMMAALYSAFGCWINASCWLVRRLVHRTAPSLSGSRRPVWSVGGGESTCDGPKSSLPTLAHPPV